MEPQGLEDLDESDTEDEGDKGDKEEKQVVCPCTGQPAPDTQAAETLRLLQALTARGREPSVLQALTVSGHALWRLDCIWPSTDCANVSQGKAASRSMLAKKEPIPTKNLEVAASLPLVLNGGVAASVCYSGVHLP